MIEYANNQSRTKHIIPSTVGVVHREAEREETRLFCSLFTFLGRPFGWGSTRGPARGHSIISKFTPDPGER